MLSWALRLVFLNLRDRPSHRAWILRNVLSCLPSAIRSEQIDTKGLSKNGKILAFNGLGEVARSPRAEFHQDRFRAGQVSLGSMRHISLIISCLYFARLDLQCVAARLGLHCSLAMEVHLHLVLYRPAES